MKHGYLRLPARITTLVLTLVVGLVCCGCNPNSDSVDTRYGMSSRAATSINGTSLFLEKLRSAGHYVTVKRRITPSISKYDVVFWMPDSTDAPSPRAVSAIERWLSEHFAPTLVYVGRHYDAEMEYLQTIRDNTTGEMKEEIYRRIAERKTIESDDYIYYGDSRDECSWYTTTDDDPTTTTSISGEWIEPGQTLPELTYSTRIEAKPGYTLRQQYSGGNWIKSDLVSVDGKPFATSMVCQSMYSQPKIILISNGCFLVNFGQVDPLKEQLSDALIAEFRPSSNILVLESGPDDIQVSDTNYENPNSWAWISEAPLRYIVPHFLFWGVLFCFAFFPIFGRPKNAEQPKTNSFRNHINAIAKQLARAKGIQRAREILQQYLNMTGERGKGDQPRSGNDDSSGQT